MIVQTVNLGGRRFVIVPEEDFSRLQRKAELLSDADAADLVTARRRLKNPREKRIPWSNVKKRAGLS